jgi:hypothetical protein
VDLADQVGELIRARWDSVHALAEVLMARGWLSYPDARRIPGARYPVSGIKAEHQTA